MYMLDKEIALKVADIVSRKYYEEMLAFYKEALVLSRSHAVRRDAKKLLGLQLDLAKAETNLWKVLREGRAKAKELHSKASLTPQDQTDLEGTERHIFIHEQLIRISRTICDGIAWRCLKYNRTFINSAARGFAAGDIDITNRDLQSEFEWAYRIMERRGGIVIINDLTHFLRVGDLTEIYDDSVFIHEIKKYGKEVKNMFTQKPEEGKELSQQVKRLLELQRIGLLNEAIIDGQPVKTKHINVRLTSNIGKVKHLIRRSEQDLIASGDIESFITVEVTNFEAIGRERHVDLEQLKSLTTPKSQGFTLVHSNWDSYFSDERGNFLRGMPPYSVFPFDNRDCMKLMSGQLLLKTITDINGFKSALPRRGWEIEDATEADVDKELIGFEKAKGSMFTKKVPLYGKTPDEVGLFTVVRGPFHLPMSTMIYGRLTMEYMTFESLLRILEEMYRIASIRQAAEAYFPRFVNEALLWN